MRLVIMYAKSRSKMKALREIKPVKLCTCTRYGCNTLRIVYDPSISFNNQIYTPTDRPSYLNIVTQL